MRFFRQLFLLLCLMGSSLAAPIPILMGEELDAAGKPLPVRPMRVQLIARLAELSKLDLRIETYPWRRAVSIAESGKGLIWGFARTPERETHFSFSQPIYYVSVWLVTPAGHTFDYHGIDDLHGKTISIPSGARFGEAFDQQRGTRFKVEEGTQSLDSQLKMLALGRVDAVTLSSMASPEVLAKRLDCEFGQIGQWAVLPAPVQREPALIAVALDSPLRPYLKRIDDAIAEMEKRGEIRALTEKPPATPCRAPGS